MSQQGIYDFLQSLNVCKICILRYLNGRCTEYLDVNKSLHEVRGIPTETNGANGTTADEENSNNITKRCLDIDESDDGTTGDSKRKKENICAACLGIFQGDMIEQIVKEIINNTNLKEYECDTIYTSVSLPILLQIRELSLWIALIRQFPDSISKTQLPNISIKEIFKFLINMRLCKETQRTLELNQDGVLVNVFFVHDCDQQEIARLSRVKPEANAGNQSGHKKSRKPMTRNSFEKNYYPDNLDLDLCAKHLPVPPDTVSMPVRLDKCTVSGPTVFVAGRYRKLSDRLCQSPWILGGKRIMEESVQEIITREIVPYFGVTEDIDKKKNTQNLINFMASGREDVDVRCLGNGRPFVVEIVNSKKTKLPVEIAADMENQVDASGKVSVHHLQLVKREELTQIKSGEESKKKMYRALCILQEPVTVETMNKLDMPDGVLVNQITPLRVLHRRPLLTRPRQIYSVKPYVHKDNHKAVILDLVTQAGTYVKEFVHGEFNRTEPSISSIIGQEIDIVALDVNGIDLDWPNEVDNKLLSRQQKKRILIESATQ